MDEQFRFPPAFTAIVALGAAVIGGLMAHASAHEGIEILEDKVDTALDKINNRKNKKTPPPPAE